jgi:hypothetical protein
MCRGAEHVHQDARQAVADLLHDIAAALDPEHPELVVIGPIDLGACS